MAVDVRPLTTGYGEEIRRLRTESLLSFRQVIEDELAAHPGHRDEVLDVILKQLRELRARARESGDVATEDILLDAMDLVTGWSAHAVRV
jgi:hypothetical protein